MKRRTPPAAVRRPHLLAALACAVLLLPLAGCAPGADAPDGAADFRLESLDGRTLGPADFPDDIVVVDFWATWCVPCRAQAKILDRLHEEWADRGVTFLAVDVAEDPDVVRAFVAENPMPYPVLLDPDDTLSPRLEILALPTVLVLGPAPQREVLYFQPGVASAATLEEVLERASAG